MRSAKRVYKDSLFRDIFNNEKRLLDVYTFLEDEAAQVEDIRITTLKETFFNSEKNDISFTVKNHHVVLIEHQSTVNANMPLRILWYIAELYRQYVEPKSPYRKKLISLPAPKFYVFYNGRTPMPKRWKMRLSDAFGEYEGAMDLVVEVVNINDGEGDAALERCAPLKAYSTFVAKVRQTANEGRTLAEAVVEAIRYCVMNNHLKEYFMEKEEREVFDMVNFQWDANLAMEVCAEEAREDGKQEGRQEGLITSIRNVMKSMDFPVEKAMDVLQIPADERAKYAALVKG